MAGTLLLLSIHRFLEAWGILCLQRVWERWHVKTVEEGEAILDGNREIQLHGGVFFCVI